jgi:hypothetical protein
LWWPVADLVELVVVVMQKGVEAEAPAVSGQVLYQI